MRYLKLITFIFLALLVSCGDPLPEKILSACEVSSDCRASERCVEGFCAPSEGQLIIEDCDGGLCECTSDESCPSRVSATS